MTLQSPERLPRRLTRNLLSNLAGTIWSAATSLIFVPIYLRLLGIEAFGLIGFYVALQGVLQVFDLGISPTINREMARYSSLPDKAGEARDLVRTLELGYWAIGFCLGLAIWVATPLLAGSWIQPVTLPLSTVEQAVRTMVVLAVVQWPLSFYQGGLMGLQQQTVANAIGIVSLTLKNFGAALILGLLSPTITAFFQWQVVVSVVQLAVTVGVLWRYMPASGQPAKIRPSMIKGIRGLAAGLSGITVTAIMITNLDKVILARSLSLADFGYYTLGVRVAGSLLLLVTPMFHVFFPRFSQLAAAKDEIGVRRLYHGSSQLVASLVLPAGVVMALFSFQLMLLWTGDAAIAERVSPIVSLLAIGTTINGLMNIPYALQLAYGRVGIALAINTAWVVLLVPCVVLLSLRFGAVGAAGAWAGLNLLYMLTGVPLTHRRLLKGEGKRWFFADVVPPAIAVLAVVGLGRLWANGAERSLELVSRLVLVAGAGAVASSLVSPQVRLEAGAIFRRIRPNKR